ncbi:NAD-dependent protein lipoamidase sirtuin-4 [Linnemannia zychae]|nr:NAD-dependent protein lipoamidase sirtuin-4 [Linnemannia zychae]
MKLRISLSKTLSTASNTAPRIPLSIASKELASFLRDGHSNIAVLTGAGVSTDSAIPDYRGENGTYTLNPDYKPVFFQDFVKSNEARHRYWARSFLGFPPVMTTEPNPTHYALTILQSPPATATVEDPNQEFTQQSSPSYVRKFITQNVDGLHQKAGTKDVIELHGTLHRVRCMSCGHEEDRTDFQQFLADLNPEWDEFLQSQSSGRLYSRMNADGDVELKIPEDQQKHQQDTSNLNKGLDYRTFQYPTCSCCGTGHYKPSVVFFGENIPMATKELSYQSIQESNGLLVIGTSLATYSAFRLVKLAKDTGIPIALINIGTSRGNELADLRYEENSSVLLKAVAQELGLGEIPGVIKRRKQVINVVGS